MKITSVEFVISAFKRSQFPKDGLAEIAFAGRSNVGKSSLLNRLAGKSIAKISGTPGKTRSINFFLINRKFYFVDLPGYGYARVSQQMRQEWKALVEGYLSRRPSLRATVVIVDIRRETIPDSDLEMIEYLRAVNVQGVVVLTKADKLNRHNRARMKKIHARQLPQECDPVLLSSVTGEGIAELQKRLAALLG